MDIERIIVLKKDGKTTTFYDKNNEILTKILRLYDEHLCFKCANAYPDKCKKIEDIRYKDITNYQFIEDGFQAFEVEKYCNSLYKRDYDRFVVAKCKRYKPERKSR